jgi:hypothetical protein
VLAAVLDTCTLWPSLQRDVLLSWAAEGLYRPLWSSAILDELTVHEQARLRARGRSAQEAERLADQLARAMTRAFDDACVSGWEPLDGTYGLPDPDDEHLVAAAVVGGAEVVVSDNTRHLPAASMPHGIRVASAAQFAADTASVAPEVALIAVRKIAARYTRPVRTVGELLAHLEHRNGWSDVARQLREQA